MNKKVSKVEEQLGYVVHSYAYKETSLILDVLTREYGRVAIMARGARRPNSQVRSVLQPFQPLLFSWFGGGDVKTLHQTEWVGGMPALSGEPLICGYYVNELLLALQPKEDSIQPQLFDLYEKTVRCLRDRDLLHSALRVFELGLLDASGYRLTLNRTVDGDQVNAASEYIYRYETGVLNSTVTSHALDCKVSGGVLLALSGERALSKSQRKEARQFLAWQLKWILSDQPLKSQTLIKRLHEWQLPSIPPLTELHMMDLMNE